MASLSKTRVVGSFWVAILGLAFSASLPSPNVRFFFTFIVGATAVVPDEVDSWWENADVDVKVWDQSWLTPRLSCGLRFRYEPHQAHKTMEGMGLSWSFDAAGFQNRAIDFYSGNGPPPMGEAWLLHLMYTIPDTLKNNAASNDVLEMKCIAAMKVAYYLYAEYLAYLVPPAVLLKYFERAWQIDQKVGIDEIPEDTFDLIEGWPPMQEALARWDAMLGMRRTVMDCTNQRGAIAESQIYPGMNGAASSCVGVWVKPSVDVVVARCKEDLAWLRNWLVQLRDEWTPEVPGLTVRLLVFERCGGASPVLASLRKLGVISAESMEIELPEPPGFENVAYVYYCRGKMWLDADFSFFLHGAPYDHMDAQTLDDILRSMAMGTYGTAFVQLNTKRLPRLRTEKCVADLLGPALSVMQPSADQSSHVSQLPQMIGAYCCSQFVVSRDRIRRVSDDFWEVIWNSLQSNLSSFDTSIPNSCFDAASRINKSHHRHSGSIAAEHGLWAVVLERVWHWIFGEDAVAPLRELDARLPLFLRVPRARSTVEGGPRGRKNDSISTPDWGFDPGVWGAAQIVRDVTGASMISSTMPVPTSHFTSVAREKWELPSWVQAWFKEDSS